MCGITGLVSAGPVQGKLEREHENALMTGALRHRGPDGSGNWLDPDLDVAFGHRRLAVIDLSPSGHQPMISGSGRYVLTYNGEIYNFLELKAELQTLGCEFRGTSDSEVLIT